MRALPNERDLIGLIPLGLHGIASVPNSPVFNCSWYESEALSYESFQKLYLYY